MEFTEKEVIPKWSFKHKDYYEFILTGDFGGTETRIGIFGLNNEGFKKLLWFSLDSKKVTKAYEPLNQVLEYAYNEYGIEVARAAVAGAGPVIGNICKLTNADVTIDREEVLNNSLLKEFYILNDFEAIGYGIELVSATPNSLMVVQDACPKENAVKVIIGAGTGLGKCILVYNKETKHYDVIPSEGGHETFSPSTNEEYKLAMYVKRRLKTAQVETENIVSGPGLEKIYRFFSKKTKKSEDIADNYHKEMYAKKAFDMFVRLYARVAKNSALNLLPYGGIYLTGGIVRKNIGIFNKGIFLEEFLKSVQSEILKKIPVYVVLDRDVALYGLINYIRTAKGN